MEVEVVVLAQTKEQAAKTTTKRNLFIGPVRSMVHESNCKKLNVAGFPPNPLLTTERNELRD